MTVKDCNSVKRRYNRIAPVYDTMEAMMEKGKFSAWRERLWKQVEVLTQGKEARLLEAGVGTGKNIPYYPHHAEIYAVDFSEKMLNKARKRAEDHNIDAKFLEMDIENLEFFDNYFDIIISTCVFCSVPDPVKGFQELRRVCKKEGRIILLEHMRTEKEPWGSLMDYFNWVSLYTWGANINRRTMDNIKKADLEIEQVNNLWLDIVKEIVVRPL